MNTELSIQSIQALRCPGGDVSSIFISSKSRVGDPEWVFDRENRPRSISNAMLRIAWPSYCFDPGLIAELQRIFALYWLVPRHLGGRSSQLKPNSFCSLAKVTLSFLDAVVQKMPSPGLLSTLAKFDCVDLVSAAGEYRGDAGILRRGLGVVFHPNAEEVVGTQFAISHSDLRRLPLTAAVRRVRKVPLYLDDELFTLISDASISRVQDFLRRMDVPVEDKAAASPYVPPASICDIADFPRSFAEYAAWRRACKKLPGGDVSARIRLARAGVKVGDLNAYLSGVNDSAQAVVCLYTGGRHSELSSFEVGCLEERDGVPCIRGAVFKQRPDIEVMDDTWVAIPAVRDAVRALEALSVVKNKKVLLSSFETASGFGRKGAGMAYTEGGLSGMMGRHLRRIDIENRFAEWRFNTHQFRHSLTRQMVKAKLGLPYISYQLKHLHSWSSNVPSDVTLEYGNASKLLQWSMAGFHLDDVKLDVARRTFDPDSPIAGGGAKAFDEKRKEYFTGLMAEGFSKEEVIRLLAKSTSGMFVNVGLGYCSGKRRLENGGQPPCIGSLRCNPVQCSNAVVTQAHAPAWKALIVENRRNLADPRLYYGRSEMEAANTEARGVLRELGAEVPG